MAQIYKTGKKEMEEFNKTSGEQVPLERVISRVARYRDLALGTRFKYIDEGIDSVWVKLSNDGTIAKWEDKNIDTRWIGQSICCLNEDGDMFQTVEIVC